MPKYYCDYCDTFLTHDSPSVRKTHCTGRKHKDNVKFYYQKWMEEQAQHLIDATTGLLLNFLCRKISFKLKIIVFILAAFKAGKIASNPFAQPPPGTMGMPPRPGMPGFNPMLPPPIGGSGMPPGFAPPNFGQPNFSLPPHAMNRPPIK